VASPHWWRGHRLQSISAVYWVGLMGTGGLWLTVTTAFHPKRQRSHRNPIHQVTSYG
jgi:hypothetical protein